MVVLNREYERERESGSHGSSVVGQATELPLESDFYFLLNRRVVHFLRELIGSFSPQSILATKKEIQGWIDALNRLDKVVLHAEPLLDLQLVPAQTENSVQIEETASVLGVAYIDVLSQLPEQHVPQTSNQPEPKLAGEIILGELPIHHEHAIVQEPAAPVAANRRGMVRQFLTNLDVFLWELRAKSSLNFKRFSLNPQPVYAKATHFAGTGFIGIAMLSMVFFGAPFLALELRAMVFRMTAPLVPQAQPQAKPSVDTAAQITNPDPDKQFQIIIPEIGVDAKVIANVDANNPAEYDEALKHGVAHAKGTGLPGDDGGTDKTIFIFSHSTDGTWDITKYNALFYSLKDLRQEDQIQVWFWGKEYWYKVVKTEIKDPTDTAFLKPQLQQEQLVLQTCWPPGTTQKRLIVTADRVFASGSNPGQ